MEGEEWQGIPGLPSPLGDAKNEGREQFPVELCLPGEDSCGCPLSGILVQLYQPHSAGPAVPVHT